MIHEDETALEAAQRYINLIKQTHKHGAGPAFGLKYVRSAMDALMVVAWEIGEARAWAVILESKEETLQSEPGSTPAGADNV